ncbi:MAG: binding-protein-dependent transport system inner rane component [Herbaspirillum sp.]|jgi:NitT/TauT family transport system permease protein|nr:binding-protein-dependent transport system inner rane component [Herbaspirillum sp.]
MNLRALIPAAFLIAALCVWELAVRTLNVPAYILPPPSAVFAAIDGNLFVDLAVTMTEAISGFAIASGCAFCVALLFVRSPVLERGLFPIAITLKTTPLVAIAPLLVLWMGTGWWSKITAAALICFFPVLVNTVKGLKAADAEYYELFRSLKASRGQEFRKLRIPYCLPYLFSALKISSSLAIVGAVVGEFVGATHGLGYLIMISSSHLDTDILFSAIFAAAVAGILLFHFIGWLEQRFIFWQSAELE